MNKKSLFFWFAAATCAAWILVGCESPTNGEAGAAGAPGVSVFTGTPSVQAINAAVASGAKVWLDGVTITGEGVIDFGTADVTVFGALETTNSGDPLVILAGESVKLAEDASIAPGADDYFIGVEAHVAAAEGALNVGLKVTSIEGAIGGITGVATLTLTEGEPTPAWYSNSSLKVFVYGTLTINGNATAPSAAKVFGIKDVVINKSTVNADTVIATLTDAAKVDVSKATITYGGSGTVEVTLPAAVSSPTFKVTSDGAVLKVGATTTTVNAHVTANNGYVEFAGAVTQATITGSGRVRFKNGSTATGFTTAASTITASVIDFPNGFTTSQYGPLTLSGDVLIPATKTITFGHEDGTLTLEEGTVVKTAAGVDPLLTAAGNVVITPVATAVLTVAAGGLDVSTAGVAFGGDVVFGGDLTLTAVPATFGGIASFANDKSLKTTSTGSVVTLGPGAALAVAGYQSAWAHILANYGKAGDVTLTPSGTATSLTFTKGATANGRSITQKPTSTGNHSIATTGDVSLVAGSTYTVNSASEKVGTLTVTSGTLSIQDGLLANDDGYGADANNVSAKLVLGAGASDSNGALLKGAGKVIAGTGVEIVGGDNAWAASDSGSTGTTTVTIEAGKIAGSAATVSLKGTTSGQSITVLAAAELTIAANTIIDVSAAGSIVLTGANTDGAILTLAEATAVIKGTGTNGAVTTANITAIGSVTVGGNLTIGANVVFTDDGTGNVFETIKGAAASNSIQAIKDATNLTIDKTTTLTYI